MLRSLVPDEPCDAQSELQAPLVGPLGMGSPACPTPRGCEGPYHTAIMQGKRS